MTQPTAEPLSVLEADNPIAQAARELAEALIDQVIAFIPNAIAALLVLLIGLWLTGRLRALVSKIFAKSKRFDQTLEGFLTSLVHYAAIAVVVIMTLGVFGVQTTSLAALIGAAGLAVGLALQGTLSHLASGVMILSFRPFNIGDYIETAGREGTVKTVTLFTTELATPDNKKVIIPNGEVWANAIVNYSAYATRRVDLVFGVSYNDELENAMAAIKSEIAKDARILADPEPVIAIDALGDSSVNILCRVWTVSSDYFPVKWSLTQSVKKRFDDEGVEIPFPTRTVYHPPAAAPPS